MQFCKDHWMKLRNALDDRGLTHLISKGKDAFDNVVSQIEGGPSTYDPLMECHWMITNRALERGGLYLLSSKPDGTQYCPVCEAVANKATEANWIEGPADAALTYCRDQGLVSKPS